QFANLLSLLRNSGFKMVATELKASHDKDTVLMAERGGETYAVTLDSELRPREIVYAAGGLDKGAKVTYSGYTSVGGSRYPKQMRVEIPGASDGSFTVQFDSVELASADAEL